MKYELHYQMITFGKGIYVFSSIVKVLIIIFNYSARLGLRAPQGSVASITGNKTGQKLIGMSHQPNEQLQKLSEVQNCNPDINQPNEQLQKLSEVQNCNPIVEESSTPGTIIEVASTSGPIVEVPLSPEPIIEVPTTPEPEQIQQELDMEDFCEEDGEEIPMIKLNMEEFTQKLPTYMERHMELGEGDLSKALVALTSEAVAIPVPKLKNVIQLRTEYQVWTQERLMILAHTFLQFGHLVKLQIRFNRQLDNVLPKNLARYVMKKHIPYRAAMRGSFPLNGTYFQVNETMSAVDGQSSLIHSFGFHRDNS
uniref:Demeter RRM-fold domain-containing protein n=1 Tax=Lactuca sativa TaxID=4236 RepID=A0A9R1UGF1_LACSA|nr:hypothetical protein LSAT_V11C900488610 [Lactuca sativa]